MILKGETLDRNREVPFPLAQSANPLLPVLGHVFTTGEVTVCVPGATAVNADIARIIEKGNGTYALVLTDAQVALDGKVYVWANVTGAEPTSVDQDIIDPTRFDTEVGAIGGGGGGLPAGPVLLSDLIDRVRHRGDYLSSLTFTDSWITNELQASWGELYELIANTFEGWWDKDVQLPTVAGQAYALLPTDLWRCAGIDVNYNGFWRELRQVGIGDRNRFQPANGCPIAYRLSARGIELFPTPDAVYTLRVTYTPIRAQLDNVNGVQFFNEWQEYVITGALLRLAMREERPLGELEAELARNRQRIIEAASLRRSQEPEYLQLREMPDWPDGGWWGP